MGILSVAGLTGCATPAPPNPSAPAPATRVSPSTADPATPPALAPPPHPAAPGAVATLDPFRVLDNPVQSFGFTVTLFGNPQTRRVTSIVVAQVWPGGPAGRVLLRPGMKILRIDGTPVQAFAATFAKGSALNRLLMNRRSGDRVRLEVAEGTTPPAEVVVIEGEGALPGFSEP